MPGLFDEAYDERNIPVNAVEDPYLKIKGRGHPDPAIGGGGSPK